MLGYDINGKSEFRGIIINCSSIRHGGNGARGASVQFGVELSSDRSASHGMTQRNE